MKSDEKAARQAQWAQLVCRDIAFAKEVAQHLLKKGWHDHYIHRRGSTRMQQTAFTTAFVVAYCRPFSGNKGWKFLDTARVDLTVAERALHKHLGELRNQVHAHTDIKKHTRRTIEHAPGGREWVILSEPPYHLTKAELEMAVVMLDKFKREFCQPLAIK